MDLSPLPRVTPFPVSGPPRRLEPGKLPALLAARRAVYRPGAMGVAEPRPGRTPGPGDQQALVLLRGQQTQIAVAAGRSKQIPPRTSIRRCRTSDQSNVPRLRGGRARRNFLTSKGSFGEWRQGQLRGQQCPAALPQVASDLRPRVRRVPSPQPVPPRPEACSRRRIW